MATPLPSRPLSSDSDPARAWGTNNPFAPLSVHGDAVSHAGSVLSVNSVTRRAAAEASYQCAQEQRRQAYEQEEERIRLELEARLNAEDVQSEAVKQEASEVGVRPNESAAAAELGVVERELADLEARRASLERILEAKRGQVTPVVVVQKDDKLIVQPLASLTVKVKATPPSAWKGVYDYAQREAWIKTVEGYFAAIGLDLQARIDEVLSPYPFHIVRSLFSSELANGGVSALSWFDARHRRLPFSSAKQVLDAVRSHWHDDQAAEAALLAYRSARQGSARARDFGSRLETLADACFDRELDEKDRISTFVAGLNSQYREFVKTQVAMLKTLGYDPTTLSGYVRLAATADGLESFSSPLKKSGGVSSSASSVPKKASVTHSGGPSTGSTPSGSGPETKTSRWRARAEDWQAAHPVASRDEWRREGDRKPPQSQYCYHCGQFALHFSASCPNACRDPKTVVLAAFKTSGFSNPPSSSTSEGEVGPETGDLKSGKADDDDESHDPSRMPMCLCQRVAARLLSEERLTPSQLPGSLSSLFQDFTDHACRVLPPPSLTTSPRLSSLLASGDSQLPRPPAPLAGAVDVEEQDGWLSGGSLSHLGPGDTVDRGAVLASPGPGDTVTPELVVVSPRPGDAVDAVVDIAFLSPGDAVDLGRRPDREDDDARVAEGCNGGSLLAIASVGRLSKGERREETEFTGSPDYSLPTSSQETSDSSWRHSTENGNPGGDMSEDERKGEEPFALPTSPRPSTLSDVGSSSGKRRRKRRNRRKKTPVREPEVADQPLTVEVILNGVKGIALTDSGSQADVLSSEFALRNGLELRRLMAPVHSDLGADGHSVRLALFTAVPCSVGPVAYESRSFFVAPLPPGIDVILDVPWLRDSNVRVSATTLSFVPEGPSKDFYDFETGQFALQPRRNLGDLGFVQRPVTTDESTRFFFCALALVFRD
ncbi:hypothetical protein JCM11641_007122 [Rhodosporidiobolus odoratus]